MKKKGQLTAFIIIGVLIVMLFSLVFFMRNKTSKLDIEFNDFSLIEQRIQVCSKNAAIESTKDILAQGGLIAPTDYYFTQYGKVPFFKNKDQIDRQLLLDNIEKLYASYFAMCLLDFDDDNLEVDPIGVDIETIGSVTIFSLSSKLSYQLGNSKKEFKNIVSEVDINLNDIVGIGNNILNEVTANMIPMSLMLDLSENTGYAIDAIEIEDFTVYWIEHNKFLLMFAIQGDFSE